MDKHIKWRHIPFMLKIVMVACMLFFVIMIVLLITNSVTDVQSKDNTSYQEQEQEVVVYDDVVLNEHDMFCPFCGESTIATNGEIVCRNEDCEVYGIPVHVSECRGSVNENCQYYDGEE